MKEKLWNTDWQFSERGKDGTVRVTVPHPVKLEPLDVSSSYQGYFRYQKTFSVPQLYENQRVFLKFEGVMTNCTVTVNGQLLKEHFGGYLPFLVDMTEVVRTDKENTVVVDVDNHDDPQTPPGKPTKDLDFLYYGGLYRDVFLCVAPPVYLTDAMDKSVERGGTYLESELQADGASIHIYENIRNSLEQDVSGQLTYTLSDGDTVLIEQTEDVFIAAKSDSIERLTMHVKAPHLWHPNTPYLYTMKTELTVGTMHDVRETAFGIRTVRVQADGLFVNGEKLHLFGLNRGQQYPYIGIAASDRAQAREAKLLKDSGVNCLRLSHYPHAPAFIDACDRLGILLIDPVPGWQFLGDAVWQKRLKENLHELCRRDRNHPSVILYEVTPNETNWSTKKGDLYLRHMEHIVKAECPSALSAGDTVGRKNAMVPNFDVPYSGKDRRNALARRLHPDTRLQLKREYGDWGFGGNKSTSRCARKDGERAMQIQTWNFQFTHNDNYRTGDCIGDLIWEGIDHNRGYYPDAPISKSGIFDIFRIPKLSYQFVRSQKPPKHETDYVLFMQALTWQDKKKLVFYSNCDTVQLFADGKLLAEQTADAGEDKPFDAKKSKQINDNYWMTKEDHIKTSEKPCLLARHAISCLFDGGNCRQLAYPPFTFTGLSLQGVQKLTVKGLANGVCKQSVEFLPEGETCALQILPQTNGVPLLADDNDFIFVRVACVDANGTVCTAAQPAVTLTVDNGETIGHQTIDAEIGIAGFLVKAHTGAKQLTLHAAAGSLTQDWTLSAEQA